jgi:hypothetical protein
VEKNFQSPLHLNAKNVEKNFISHMDHMDMDLMDHMDHHQKEKKVNILIGLMDLMDHRKLFALNVVKNLNSQSHLNMT